MAVIEDKWSLSMKAIMDHSIDGSNLSFFLEHRGFALENKSEPEKKWKYHKTVLIFNIE